MMSFVKDGHIIKNVKLRGDASKNKIRELFTLYNSNLDEGY
jgi:hypothetical protein